ncbi:MAG TPA: MbnP family protein [Opitutaceae bacterium]
MRCPPLLTILLFGWAVSMAGAADLTLALELRWGATPLTVPSPEVKNDAGQSLRLTRIAGIVSGVTLVRADGGRVWLEGQYGYFDAETAREIRLQGVPAGDYVALEFQVGLPAAVNHGDPSRWPAGHALNPLTTGLHWNWQGGYVFFALEGRWRDPSEVEERGLLYHVATTERAMALGFAARFRVETATRIALALDVSRILRGRKLAGGDGSDSTHSSAGDPVAVQIAQATERAWFWLGAEEVAPKPVAVGRAQGGSASSHAPAGEPLAFVVPEGFPQPELPSDNPLTREGVALGRALFHDRRLSGNGTQSCASCHAPALGFSEARAVSIGAEGKIGRRNAMPLFNLAWSPAYAWDGGQRRVRDQSLAALRAPIEMHGDPAVVAAALAADAEMAAAFRAAFGGGPTEERVGLALEQYLLTLVSADSKFDRARRGEAELTPEEKRGLELFLTEYDPARGKRGADCFHCHGGALFTDYAFKNNGFVTRDRGRLDVTGALSDDGKFKTPSLRNVELTAPYMHDGRLRSLEEVIAHYDHRVRRSPTLDPNLAKHPAEGLQLSREDQWALVAFLRTLTDEGLAAK